jgi:DamX protein
LDAASHSELIEQASDKNSEVLTKIPANPIIDESQGISTTEAVIINGQYQGQEQGFVIQLAGFTQQNVLNEFLAEFQGLPLYQYQRLVNDETMTIVTSEYFQDRQQAEQAIAQLPQTIQERSPWIKAITTINDEINRFQRSQSVENQVTIPVS